MIRTLFPLIVIASTAVAEQSPGAHFIENWDLDEDGQVTVAEAAERRGDVFTTFDANDDGYLDAEEYVAFDEARENDMRENAMPGNGTGRGQHAANGLRREVNDADNDGTVSREEFVSGTESWIVKMDTDGDGVITTADFGRGKGAGTGQGQGLGKGKGQGMGQGKG
ncbi:MAG: EF-hand domain-containing protein [Pelagimonas sp.]|uniref:EF-hand domain-containing protein n=1 Tax=Pelagimonas sp. TaxID=2073170 RepID=UPI003D6B885B